MTYKNVNVGDTLPWFFVWTKLPSFQPYIQLFSLLSNLHWAKVATKLKSHVDGRCEVVTAHVSLIKSSQTEGYKEIPTFSSSVKI